MGTLSIGQGISRGVCVAMLALGFCGFASAAAVELRIGGTGNALGTIRLLADAFGRSNPQSTLTVLDSIGTSGGIKAVAKKAIDIGLSSRPLTDEESRSGLVAVEYARSPTVFAVPERSKVTAITVRQVADIYGGRTPTWPDGTPVRPVMRQSGDDNTRQIRQLSPDIEKALTAAEQRPGLAFATTDQEAADKMEGTPGSIGVTTLALIRSEKRKLRALVLDGVEPTPEAANAGRYPMIKRFFFITAKESAPAIREFLGFVQSAQGRRILEQSGNSLP